MSDENNNNIRKLGGGSHPDGTIWEKTKFKNIWRENLTDDQKAEFFSWFKDLAICEGLPRSAGIVQGRLCRLEESQINMSQLKPPALSQSTIRGAHAPSRVVFGALAEHWPLSLGTWPLEPVCPASIGNQSRKAGAIDNSPPPCPHQCPSVFIRGKNS
jgi:hypothetical protein